jgi:hypothetical protein
MDLPMQLVDGMMQSVKDFVEEYSGSDLYDSDRLEKIPTSNKRLEQHPHID